MEIESAILWILFFDEYFDFWICRNECIVGFIIWLVTFIASVITEAFMTFMTFTILSKFNFRWALITLLNLFSFIRVRSTKTFMTFTFFYSFKCKFVKSFACHSGLLFEDRAEDESLLLGEFLFIVVIVIIKPVTNFFFVGFLNWGFVTFIARVATKAFITFTFLTKFNLRWNFDLFLLFLATRDFFTIFILQQSHLAQLFSFNHCFLCPKSWSWIEFKLLTDHRFDTFLTRITTEAFMTFTFQTSNFTFFRNFSFDLLFYRTFLRDLIW